MRRAPRFIAITISLIVALCGTAAPLFAAAGSTQRVGPIDLDEMTPEQRRQWLGITAEPPGDMIDAGFDMFSTSSASTGEKPQSKLWYHDGSYWGILRGPDGVAFYEKQGTTWVRGTFANAVVNSSGNADVKWTGTHLFVLIYASTSRVYEYTYNAGTRAWVLTSGFPVTVPNPSGSETMVLESDSSGRLWTCAEGGGNINVYYSTSADRRTWSSSPVILASGVSTDDICSIVAFGGNRVGVFWSDQNRDEFGFRYHNDADAPTTWAAKEIADSGSGHADDHINLAYDSTGRVFAISKDDNDEMRVHRRNTNGSWTTVTNVCGGSSTRGVIMVAENESRLYILYTRWGVSPERIEYRYADINSMSFGNTVNFIDSSSDMNNVTDMKQILPPGSLCAVASNSSRCLYNSFGNPPAGGGAQPPAVPTGLQANLQAGPQVGLSWTAPSGTIDGYNIFRQTNGGSFSQINASLVGSTSYTDTAPPFGSICYQVRAVRSGLQSSPTGSACVTNDPPEPPEAPTSLVATLESGPQVDLDWTAPSGTIDGYNVYRQVNGGSFVKLNGALVAATTYLDSSPAAGSLCYQVRSQRTAIESSASNSACVDNTPPALPPNAPTNLTANYNDGSGPPPGQLMLSMGFDEGTGQIVNDASGHDNHGTRGSSAAADGADGTFTTGIAGGALQFDGNNDRLEIPDSPTLDPAGSFTIELWARRSGSTGTLVAKGNSGTRTFRVRITSSSHVEFLWERADGTDQETVASGAASGNGWHHIACVYDQTASQNRIYVDGVLRASSTASGTAATNTSPLIVGAHQSGTSRTGFLNGAVDLLRIHPAAIYSANFTPPQSLVAGTTFAATAPSEGEVDAESIDLAWQAPSGGTPVASYNVYRSVDGGTATQLNATAITVTHFSDTNLVEGQLCYNVRAVSAAALEGAPSNIECVTLGPPPPPPAAPGPPQNPSVNVVTSAGGPVTGTAAWPFDEGGGDTFLDATGNGHTGQLGASAGADASDPLWTTGVAGSSALRFDGTNDRATVVDAPALRFAGSFTLEAWVKRDVLGVSHCVLAKGDSQRRNYWMLIDSSNRIDFRWETSGGSNRGARSPSSAMIADTNWHHIACVYDQAASQSRIYIDGILVESETGSGTPVTSADPVHLGTRLSSGSFTNWFRGSIDLARVSSGVLYSSNFTPATSFGGGPPQTVAQLAWEAPLTGLAAGYNVYRSVDGGAFTKINGALITLTSWVDTAPPAGALCYHMTAVDALAQEGDASADACDSIVLKANLLQPKTEQAARMHIGPNPFNPTTTISFALPTAERVHIAIYDVRGHRVATLADSRFEPGTHRLAWHGRDAQGARVASGTYFVTLDAGATHLRSRLVLLK